MDKIYFEQMQFYAYHGVLEEENRLGQKFEVDLEMFLDLRKAGESDNLDKTVNYAKVYDVVKGIVIETKMKLLEAIAENIASTLLGQFPLDEIVVRVRKLNPPIHGYLKSVSVEIRRRQSNNE
ncbi:MAG: dihydroneopterin aldolase [Vulcanibacillus sp.]